MVAFLTRMPVGWPGAYNRTHDATVEPTPLAPGGPAPTAYGVALTMTPTGAALPAAAASIYGMYVRPYPTNSNQDPLGTDTPPTPANAGNVDVMVRGYLVVKLLAGTAVKGAPYEFSVTGGNAGGVAAVGSGGATPIACPGRSYFMGPADANGMVEIAFNI